MTATNDSPKFQHQPAEQIDMICDEFEAAWGEGQSARAEDFLSRIEASHQSALLRELLELELDYRHRRGEGVDRAELEQRFPAHAALIESLFPSSPDNPQSEIRIPQAIGQYRLLAKIGEGGMGAVYRAMHTRLEKIVALKVLPADRTRDAEALARFNREMKAVGRLQHPNIVGAHDAGEADGVHYLVMEYVDGVDLDRLLKQHGPLPVSDACELVRQAALGLQEAHEHQMVHRDIKPSNLMLTVERSRKKSLGIVKILDLGLALLEDPSQGRELTTTGQLMGTIDYMSPEQVQNTHRVDIRTDIYALGVTLYKLLTGVSPFAFSRSDTAYTRMNAVVHSPPTPIAQHRPDVPPELAAIIQRMLAKKAEDRPATPDEVAEALAPFGGHLNVNLLLGEGKQPATDAGFAESTHPSRLQQTLRPSTPPPVPTPPRATGSISRPAMFVAAAVVVVGGLLLAWQLFRADGKTSLDNVVTDHASQTQAAVTPISVTEMDKPFGVDTALEFDGDDEVVITGLSFDPKAPYTMEGFITAPAKAPGGNSDALAFGIRGQSELTYTKEDYWRWVYDRPLGTRELAISRVPVQQQRTHLACVRDGQTLRLYVNGKLFESKDVPNPGKSTNDFSVGERFRGIVDELRLSSVARYDADFPPPTRFTPDEHTLALYHFDDGAGDVLTDSSGNNHHGKIVGAQWVRVENAAGPISVPVPARASGDKLWTLVETQTLDPKQLQESAFFSPAVSHDGLALVSTLRIDRPGASSDRDLALSTRASRNTPWSPLVSLGSAVNSQGDLNTDEDAYGSISQDQRTLVFFSKREKSESLWLTTRERATEPFGKSIKLGDEINVKLLRSIYPGLSANAHWLTFARKQGAVLTGWIAQRHAADGSYHLARPFGPAIDALGILWRSTVSNDGLTLVCVIGSSSNPFADNGALWTASRTSTNEAFQNPQRLEASLGGVVGSLNVVLSGDGHTLWIHRERELLRLERPESSGAALASARAPFDAAQARAYQEAWAARVAAPVEWTNSVGMELRIVPPGEFLMGCTEAQHTEIFKGRDNIAGLMHMYSQERPQHRVVLSRPFAAGVHEVTIGQFRKFIEATGYTTEAERLFEANPKEVPKRTTWRTAAAKQSAAHPVTGVTWNDAREFCTWLSRQEGLEYRLPTEAEWEYLCRAGLDDNWAGEQETLSERAWHGIAAPEVVGRKTGNAFGLHDVQGNVIEWCQDTYDGPYQPGERRDPVNSGDPKFRIVRGGHVANPIDHLRPAKRGWIAPTTSNATSGFRVVLTNPEKVAAAQKAVPSATSSKSSVDADRQAAEWVLSLGGKVQVNDQEAEIANADSLPQTSFTVTAVDLSKTLVTDALLARLKDLKGLTALRLIETEVTDEGLAELQPLEKLRFLSLEQTRITGAGLVHLEGLKSLGGIGLSATAITDDDLVHLKACSALYDLSLINTRVGDDGMLYLKAVRGLKRLFLDGTQVTDAGLMHLKALKGLTYLEIRNPHVTAKGVANFQSAVPGCKVTASTSD